MADWSVSFRSQVTSRGARAFFAVDFEQQLRRGIPTFWAHADQGGVLAGHGEHHVAPGEFFPGRGPSGLEAEVEAADGTQLR